MDPTTAPRWPLRGDGEVNRNCSPTLSLACDYIICTYDHLSAKTISILLPSVLKPLYWKKGKWSCEFEIPPSTFKEDQISCQARFCVDGTPLPPFNLYKQNRNSYLIEGSMTADTSVKNIEHIDKMEDPQLRKRRMARPLSLPDLRRRWMLRESN